MISNPKQSLDKSLLNNLMKDAMGIIIAPVVNTLGVQSSPSVEASYIKAQVLATLAVAESIDNVAQILYNHFNPKPQEIE